MNALSLGSPSDAWDIFLLFTIPIGGGIPAGVLLGQSHGIGAFPMAALYLVSALIAISFGIDPMTGRTAALAHGHGFLSGWAIAIVGDMLFLFLIMASTIWLNSVIGDGTWTAVIIMVAMLSIPAVIRRIRTLK